MNNDDDFDYGDPRHCPVHPEVVTSSPDGMFDAPCGACEAAMEEPSDPKPCEQCGKVPATQTVGGGAWASFEVCDACAEESAGDFDDYPEPDVYEGDPWGYPEYEPPDTDIDNEF